MAFNVGGDNENGLDDLGIGEDFGGGGTGGRTGGGGGGTAPRGIVPPAPTGVRARVNGVGSLTVKWNDYRASDWRGGYPFTWFVRFCPATLAGDQSGNTWVTDVLFKSHHIGSVPAAGDGRQLSITRNEDIPDGYVLVVGSTGPLAGAPSFPLFVNVSGNTGVTPDVTMIGAAIVYAQKERVPYDVLRLDAQYGMVLPPEPEEFKGVHLHMVGYDGVTTPLEVGPLGTWDGTTGQFITITRRLPIEAGQGSGVATFTNGSANVVRVSGTNFAAGWVNREILIDLDSTTAHDRRSVATFTDANHIAMNAVFTGTTGDYSWKVLNAITFYFVPVGKSGARVGDYTTATSYVL